LEFRTVLSLSDKQKTTVQIVFTLLLFTTGQQSWAGADPEIMFYVNENK